MAKLTATRIEKPKAIQTAKQMAIRKVMLMVKQMEILKATRTETQTETQTAK
jgi:hypothetical protein